MYNLQYIINILIMNEINKNKKVIFYPENNLKIPYSNYSNILSTNRTNNFNDSNNIKSNSSLFTNEALIKSIANITSPYNKFYPKMKPILRNALRKENRMAIKNKLLLTNYSSFYINGIKSFSSRFFNIKEELWNRSNSFKDLNNKNNNLIEKKLDDYFYKQKNENDEFISKAQVESNRANKKLKLLKFKVNRILKQNSLNICDTFEKRNELFNIKLKNYLDSDRYIKGKKLESDNFDQNKKGFSSSHNLLNYYYESLIDKKSNEEIKAYSLINSLSKDEKKIIYINPKYFEIDKNKILAEKLRIVVNESLKDKIIKEEKSKSVKNYSFMKEENKTFINNNIKRIYKQNLNYKDKIYNEKKINKKMIEYHHNNLIKSLSKNKFIEFVNSGIKNYYKQYYSSLHNKYMKSNNYKDGDYDYKMFNYPLDYKMTKEFHLNKNVTRIKKEKHFHLNKNKTINKNHTLLDKLKNCQEIIKKNYSKK